MRGSNVSALLCGLFAAAVAWAQAVTFDVDRNLFQPAVDPIVSVVFTSPLDVEGHLDVYNSAGEQVRRLFPGNSEMVQANVPVVSAWDGKNADGEEVASGVYFFRLRLGEDVRIRRILVVR